MDSSGVPNYSSLFVSISSAKESSICLGFLYNHTCSDIPASLIKIRFLRDSTAKCTIAIVVDLCRFILPRLVIKLDQLDARTFACMLNKDIYNTSSYINKCDVLSTSGPTACQLGPAHPAAVECTSVRTNPNSSESHLIGGFKYPLVN